MRLRGFGGSTGKGEAVSSWLRLSEQTPFGALSCQARSPLTCSHHVVDRCTEKEKDVPGPPAVWVSPMQVPDT